MIARIEEGIHAFLERKSSFRVSEIKATILSEIQDTRRVVQYSFYSNSEKDAPEMLSVVGKFYSQPDGAEVFQLMTSLNEIQKHQSGGTLAVPSPLFYDPAMRLLVMQEAPGLPYPEILRKRKAPSYLEMAAKALSEIHHLDEPSLPVKTISNHLLDLIAPAPERLSDHFPNYQSLIASSLRTFEEIEKQWQTEIVPVCIHRDFHLRQLFYEAGRVWVVDWDLCCQGDPALDLGNFLVYLETHISENLSRFQNAFLTGYFANNPASIFRRVWLYKAFTYLRLACKSFRLHEPVERMKEMLLQMETCLNREKY